MHRDDDKKVFWGENARGLRSSNEKCTHTDKNTFDFFFQDFAPMIFPLPLTRADFVVRAPTRRCSYKMTRK